MNTPFKIGRPADDVDIADIIEMVARVALVAIVATAATPAAAALTPPFAAQPQERVDFRRDVQPIFRQHCYSCHGAAVHQNGLRLDRRSGALRGGTGPVLGAGDSGASRLYLRVTGTPGVGPQMPPTGPLRPEQIAIIKRWIDEGADWPDEAAGETPPRPTPPLMTAVLRGDRAAVRRLLAEGANVNDRDDAGATALMWALDDPEIARLLLEHGADVNARSDDERTPLIMASARHRAAPVVALLLAHGADPSATAPGQGGRTNPLVEASLAGELDSLRLLRAAGADLKPAAFVAAAFALHADCGACFDLLAPALEPKDVSYATLVLVPPIADGRKIAPLLDRGADVNIRDGEGRTLLMRLAASDVAPPALVRTLIARGADVNAKSSTGDTALGFAKQRGHTPIVDLLIGAGATEAADAPSPVAAPSPAASARAAVERSLPLLQQADVTFLQKSGCVSCHNNTLTAMTVALARSSGVRVDEEIAQGQVETIGRFVDGWRERARQGIGIPGDHDTISAILLGLSAEAYGATAATEAMAQFLLRVQTPDGHWRITEHRPPIESSDIEVTAASLRALQVYAPRNAGAEYGAAIRRAAAWLAHAQPDVTEARAFQLMGFGWSNAPKAAIQRAARALMAEQRSDGGWSQLPTLASDAYATGEALVALKESGAIAASDPAFKRGVDFLLETQHADGSWFVRSRSIAFQPYFESGFPYGHDQFISAAATNWATMALALAVQR
jgi:ankyrin repeat protein/mono/diheme cytochrome c family protein